MKMGVALGLDVGERRIGVAVGDPSGLLASPRETIMRTADKRAVEAIQQLVQEHAAEVLVVGLPLTAEGAASAQSDRIASFARKLRAIQGVRVVFWDERYSTSMAEAALRSSSSGPRRVRSARQREARRRRLDAAAAAVILQDYLDHVRAASECVSS